MAAEEATGIAPRDEQPAVSVVSVEAPVDPENKAPPSIAAEGIQERRQHVQTRIVSPRVGSARNLRKLKFALIGLAAASVVVLGLSAAALALAVNISGGMTELRSLADDHHSSTMERAAILEGRIDNETVIRTSADNNLQMTINSEVAALKSTDENLNTSLQAEVSARMSGDAPFNATIQQEKVQRKQEYEILRSNVSQEITIRQTEVSDVNASLTTEASARSSQDATLRSDLSTETTARTNADSTLTTNLNSEISSRIAGDAPFNASIMAEIAARKAADDALTTRISNEEATRASAVATLNSTLQTEISTRSSQDAAIRSNLTTEVSTRQSADATLTASISNEESARKQVDEAINGTLQSEIADRKQADADLSSRISAEVSNRTAEVATLAADFQSETTTRSTVDAELREAINNETSERSAADTQISANLQTEISSRSSAVDALNTSLTQEAQTRKSVDDELRSDINAATGGGVADTIRAINNTVYSEIAERKSADNTLDNKIISTNNGLCGWHGVGCTFVNLNGGTNGPVYFVDFSSSSSLSLGGDFTTSVGGTVTNHPYMVNLAQDGAVTNWGASGSTWFFWTSGRVNKYMWVSQCGGQFAFGDFLSATDNNQNTERTYAKRIAYWKSDGSKLESVGTGADAEVHDAVMAPGECEMYIVGKFTTVHGQPRNRIVHQSAREVSNVFQREWNAVGDGCDGDIYTIAIDSASNVLFMGGAFLSCGNVSTPYIASYNIANSSYASLGAPLTGPVNKIVVSSGGWSTLYVGGNFTVTDGSGQTVSNAAIYQSNTNEWSSLGNPNAPIRAIALQGDVVYLGGDFTTIGGESISGLAVKAGDYFLPIDGAPTSGIYALHAAESRLAIGGNFTVEESGMNNVGFLYRSF
mmetsp:Transcript_4345/g.8737  ORF Transcript_4345/g.8737 Transcript_4345/m.8737 type:complete len:884 (-) Transcript_4345:325-2976(-)